MDTTTRQSAIGRGVAPQMDRVETWLGWFALLVPALLLLLTAHAIWTTYSPTPYVDQWIDLGHWREAAQKGWIGYLVSPHNEHRIFFPRLIFMADQTWFGGRDILNLIVIGLLQLLGAGLFVRLVQIRRLRTLGLLGLAAALSLIFSLMQWQSLIWGFCVQMVGVYAAAAWAIYAFCVSTRDPRAPRRGWMAAALVLLTLATFSMANGALAGAAMVLVALVTRRGPRAAVVAGLSTTILLAVYLHGYRSPTQHDPLSFGRDYARVITYFVTFLGNIWAPGHNAAAALFGVAGVMATVGMLIVVRGNRNRDPVQATLFGVALFVGLSAVVTSAGRIQLGLGSAFASRYMTPTAYFWAAQAVFWALAAERDKGRASKLLLGGTLALALGRLVALQAVGYKQALGIHDGVVLASSALLNGAPDGAAILPISVFVDRQVFQEDIDFLRSRRMSLFADPPAATVGSLFARPIAPAGACRGAFESLAPAPDIFGQAVSAESAVAWRAGGWGWDADGGRSLSQIVLVGDTGRVLGIGLAGVSRPDLMKARRDLRALATGWIAALPRGAGHGLIAYGITTKGTACELGRRTWPTE